MSRGLIELCCTATVLELKIDQRQGSNVSGTSRVGDICHVVEENPRGPRMKFCAGLEYAYKDAPSRFE